MKSLNTNLLVFLLVLIVGSILVAFVAMSQTPRPHSTMNYGLITNGFGFGSSGISNEGWLLPANTVLYTTYSSNVSLHTVVTAYTDIFLYQIGPKTTVSLGLYINGILETTQDYNVSSISSTPSQLSSTVATGLATFTNTVWSFPIALALNNPLPSGTEVTLAVTFTHPVWVQVDPSAPVASNEIPSSSFASQLPSFTSASQAPHTISVGVETNA